MLNYRCGVLNNNMPQDNLRSVVYRSFVTCDDPKGVVDCRPIRKSKNVTQKMEARVESCGTHRSLSAPSTYKEERHVASKGFAEGLLYLSSFQLMEVSKGTQKLHQVIDSWSKGMNIDGYSKDIAKELLKGALDLQESLIVLGKLQEASPCMRKLKKKQDESRKVSIEKMGSDRMISNQFGNQVDQMGFQKQRFSADGSSRDCFEELRQVISDSLARQNLLPNCCTQVKASHDRRTSDTALDFPLSGSSHSTIIGNHKFASSACPLPVKVPQKVSKKPNLIAKLVGLEEVPSKQLQSNRLKQSQSGKISYQRGLIFDVDMPKAKKPLSVARKMDREQKTLKEVIETMQFKGLLRGSSVKVLKPSSHHPNAMHSRKRSVDNSPPIVIVKPLNFPYLEAEEPCTQVLVQEEGDLESEEMLREFKIIEELSPEIIDHWDETVGSPINRLSREEVDYKEILVKPEEKEVQAEEMLPSSKLKCSGPAVHKAQKKEAIDKEVDKLLKVTPARRKPVKVENVKSIPVSKSHNDVKVIPKKTKDPEKGLNVKKYQIAQQKCNTVSLISRRTKPITSHSSTSHISRCTKPITSHSSTSQKKNLKIKKKQAKGPPAANLSAKTMGCKDVTKGINGMNENATNLVRANFQSAEGIDASEIQVKAHCNNSQRALCEVTLQTIQHESCSKSVEESSHLMSQNSTQKEFLKTKTSPRDLLLSSQSFISHAKGLFCIVAHQPLHLQASENDTNVVDTRLLLDCANKLMELKSLQWAQTAHPLLQTPIQTKICISLDQLAEEVCVGIENLTLYNKLAGQNLPTNGLHAVLERDLRGKEMASEAWDLGWRNGFTVDEVEQVVGDIEKLVLSFLIEGVLADFVV